MAKDFLTEFLPDLEEFRQKHGNFITAKSPRPSTRASPEALEAMPSGAAKPICCGFAWQAADSPESASDS